MLTAEREVEQKVRGLRAGADDYLIKPFHPAELMARIKSLLARFAPHETLVGRPPLGRVLALYGAKGGVGTTTIAINAAIALHRELGRKVCLVDGNLQFGDHRVFLDLGLDKKAIVDIVTAPTIDQDLVRQVLVKHDSGVDLLLAPPSPETAELVTPEHMPMIIDQLRDEQEDVGQEGRHLGAGRVDVDIDAVGNIEQACGKDAEEQDHRQRIKALVEIGPGGRLDRRWIGYRTVECNIGHVWTPLNFLKGYCPRWI